MSNERASSSGGVGCFTLMFLIFLTLRLTHFIDWSWWLVTAPLWGPPVVFGLIVLFVAAFSPASRK